MDVSIVTLIFGVLLGGYVGYHRGHAQGFADALDSVAEAKDAGMVCVVANGVCGIVDSCGDCDVEEDKLRRFMEG